MYFIQENDKPNLFSKIFLIPTLIQDKILVPIDEKKELNDAKEIRLANKIRKLLQNGNCKKLIVSSKIRKYETFCNCLISYNFDIADGRWLFSLLFSEILEYICVNNNLAKQKMKIAILVNDNIDITLENLKQIVNEYGKIHIVSNHIEKFKKIEKQILDQYGIMITIGNNKKKSLERADVILNMDFPNELINKYRIAENAIIVNIRGNVKIKQKRFNGQIFNNYEITYENEENFDYDKEMKFSAKDIYESLLYKGQPLENILNKIKKDKVKILNLLKE